jgi:hypothetical protein
VPLLDTNLKQRAWHVFADIEKTAIDMGGHCPDRVSAGPPAGHIGGVKTVRLEAITLGMAPSQIIESSGVDVERMHKRPLCEEVLGGGAAYAGCCPGDHIDARQGLIWRHG